MGWWIEAAKRITMVTYRSNEVLVRCLCRQYVHRILSRERGSTLASLWESPAKKRVERKSWRESLGL